MADEGEQRETTEWLQATPSPRPKILWRKNVLTLMLVAYLSIFLIFVVMVLCGVDAKDAYDKISVPFVALIGGTLAITKDLLG